MDIKELQNYINHGMDLLPDIDEYVSCIAFGTYSQCRQRRELHQRASSDYNDAATAFQYFWHNTGYLAETAMHMVSTAALALNCLRTHDETGHELYDKCFLYIVRWTTLYVPLSKEAV